jgi:hypothetical protein
VRDELWELAVAKAGRGSVLQVWSYPCPQGYRYRAHNASGREFVDLEGLTLVRVKPRRIGEGGNAGKDAPAAEPGSPDSDADAGSDGSLTTE